MKKLFLLFLLLGAAATVYSGAIDISPFLRGIELPSLAGDNLCPSDKAVAWYNTLTNKVRACQNGSPVDMIQGGTAANPAGSNTQVQFNNNGAFAGDPGLLYDQVADRLTVGDFVATSGSVGGSTVVTTNDARLSDQRTPPDGAVTTAKIADLNVTTGKLANGAVDASKASTAAATDLGNTNAAGSATSLARSDHVHKRTVRIKKDGADVAVRNALNLIQGSNVTLTCADDSVNDEVDCTIASTGGGGSAPGGTDTQVQFNDGGSALGGDAGFTYNKTTDTATLVNLVVTALTCTGCIGTTQVANLDAADVPTGIFGSTQDHYEKPSVRLVATANAALATAFENGDTLDGVVLATNDRILLVGQTLGQENGIRVVAATGTPARAADADTAPELTNFTVYVREGSAGNLGSTWKHTTTGAITVDTTPLTFIKTGVGPTAERTGNKNINNGYAGLSNVGNLSYDQIGSSATATLSAASQLTVSARQMLIDGNAGPVDLTSNPQIVAGAKDGIETQLIGTHATNTVKFDNGNGLRLCGNTGSVIVGLNGAKPFFRWNATLSVWEQTGCQDLQRGFDISNKIQTGNGSSTGLQVGDVTGGNYCSIFYDGAASNFPTVQCFCGGAACDLKQIVQTGKLGQWFSDTTEIARLTQSTNTFDFLGGHLQLRGGTGAPTGTDCDAAGEARRIWIQTDASPECMIHVCNGSAWKNQCGVKSACRIMENVVAADDNRLFGSVDKDITVKSTWCHYEGAAPTTAATFSLVGMTHTAPTCGGPTAQATKQTVTAGNSVTARTPIRWSVTNTPNPATDTYELCVGYDTN